MLLLKINLSLSDKLLLPFCTIAYTTDNVIESFDAQKPSNYNAGDLLITF